mmetsp:Transcript_12809/g.19412  ORF Transcript_12809/g.19412 Transcript_12809/m.19412 type:complete len:85 (-) Transcript_12809:2855-3109(-)
MSPTLSKSNSHTSSLKTVKGPKCIITRHETFHLKFIFTNVGFVSRKHFVFLPTRHKDSGRSLGSIPTLLTILPFVNQRSTLFVY